MPLSPIGEQHGILILSGVLGDTRRYRTFHPYQQLCLAGVPCSLSHLTAPDLPARMVEADVVILHRVPMDGFVNRLLEEVHRRGGLVVADIDDLLFDQAAFEWIDSPDFSDPVRAALYKAEMRRQREMLLDSDAITVSTAYLDQRLSSLNRPVWVHHNAASLEMLDLSEKVLLRRSRFSHTTDTRPPKVVIGYASGTPTHDSDFAQAAGVLRQVLRRHPEAELWLVGPLRLEDSWQEFGDRVQHRERVPWQDLPALLAQFDINLAPLVMDNPFSLAKSEIKYMEAGLVGVPTIASRTPAFQYAITPGINGLLAGSEPEWLEGLEQLVSSPELRQAVGAQAHAQVLANYHPARRSVELVETLNKISLAVRKEPLWDGEALERMAAFRQEALQRSEQFWLPARIEEEPSLARRAAYMLRHRGPGTLLGLAWVFFRRLVSPWFPFRPRKNKAS